jgi:transcriptional regulator with XRE-family HTH domain
MDEGGGQLGRRRPAGRVGTIVRRLRQERGESLRDLARRAGLSPIQLSRVERLESDPTEEKIAGLAAALGVPVGVLFGEVWAPGAAAGAGSEAGAAEGGSVLAPDQGWLWPTFVEWERLVARLQDPALGLPKRRDVAAGVAELLKAQRLTLGQPEFYADLRQVWVTHDHLDDRLRAASERFARHRPQPPGAAQIFPRFRYAMDYRRGGLADHRYEFSLANIGPTPVQSYENWASGDVPRDEEEIGLQITHPDGSPAARIEWRPRSGNALHWRANLLRPLQPGETRELVEHWVWPYPPPLTAIRSNTFTVDAFMGELEIAISFPAGFVAGLNTAWVRDCDGSARTIEMKVVSASPPRAVVREELPPFDGSDQYTVYTLLQHVTEAGSSAAGHRQQVSAERR